MNRRSRANSELLTRNSKFLSRLCCPAAPLARPRVRIGWCRGRTLRRQSRGRAGGIARHERTLPSTEGQGRAWDLEGALDEFDKSSVPREPRSMTRAACKAAEARALTRVRFNQLPNREQRSTSPGAPCSLAPARYAAHPQRLPRADPQHEILQLHPPRALAHSVDEKGHSR